MICAAIVAGGTGSRMGLKLPKQFASISGKPILIRTIECFQQMVDIIIVACHSDYVEYTKKLVGQYFEKPIEVIPGGDDRMGSVMQIVRHLRKLKAKDEDILLTHDGVRPFVAKKTIEDSIKNARDGHFCTVAVNATDTVCVSLNGEMINEVLDRKQVFNIQTPQTFNLGTLESMLENLGDGEYTDLCGLAIATGIQVKIIEGSRENIKITMPMDLKFAETIIEGEKPL